MNEGVDWWYKHSHVDGDGRCRLHALHFLKERGTRGGGGGDLFVYFLKTPGHFRVILSLI